MHGDAWRSTELHRRKKDERILGYFHWAWSCNSTHMRFHANGTGVTAQSTAQISNSGYREAEGGGLPRNLPAHLHLHWFESGVRLGLIVFYFVYRRQTKTANH